MTTTIHLSQWGNSLALAIPNEIVGGHLIFSHISVGAKHSGRSAIGDNEGLITGMLRPYLWSDDTVICRIENGKLVLEPVNKTLEYTLDQLLAGDIEPSEEVFWGKSEGDEIL
jgi:antitoxin component of MazEF toxin-antitoxin module